MKPHQLAISRRADRDADGIYDWIAERSATGALHWFDAFRDALHAVSKNPQSYSRAAEADMVARDLRQVSFKTQKGRWYRALFIVVDDTVHVLAIRGAAQDFATLDDLELPP